MNKVINVCDNKVLKLTNALSKTIIINEITKLDKSIESFDLFLKCQKLETKGPLVIKTEIIFEDKKEVRIILIKQLKEDIKIKYEGYEYSKEQKIEPCLFSRFTGQEKDIRYVDMKMQLYAFEKNIVLSDESYSIILKNENGIITLDTFIPIIGRYNDENM